VIDEEGMPFNDVISHSTTASPNLSNETKAEDFTLESLVITVSTMIFKSKAFLPVYNIYFLLLYASENKEIGRTIQNP
jgi:hypothetical protein